MSFLQMQDKWTKIKFGDIAFPINENETNPLQNGITKYVAGEHIESENLYVTKFGDIKTNKEVIGSAFHRKFSKGDILFGTRRAYLKKAGIATFDGICANTTLVLRPKNKNFAKELLPFIVQWEKFTEFAVSRSVGSTNPYVRWRDLADFEFHLPSLSEQTRISQLFWSIQKSVDSLEVLIQRLKTYKNSKTNELLTRGIGHTKFKKVKWLFGKEIEIPQKWEIKTFDNLFEFLKTGTNSRSDLGKGDVHYIHYGDIHAKWKSVLNCDHDEIPLIEKTKVEGLPLLKDGDLVIVDASEDYEGSGSSVVLKNVKNKKIVSGLHTITLRNKDEKISSDFKIFVTSMNFVKKQIISYVTGISVFGLSKNNLKKIKIPLPPIPEQQEITRILLNIDEQIKQLEDHLSKLKTMRKSIINEKLTPPSDKIVQ